jgi:alkanesulfonate monooxygenase SsuD/methylene tetrahydromethanopterin reductase-like flavin-dependent oxidoreductase (luciferase family)
MEVSITVEGQRGLTWDKWKVFAPAVEALGFAGLYRSDHFVDAAPPDLPSLELWVSLTWLADHTSSMQIGSLVTPVSFRHPVHTARMARDLSQLSGGRFVLGVGAGWGGAEREHRMFGFDLLPVRERFLRFEEGLEVISLLLTHPEPVSYTGRYYQLHEAYFVPVPGKTYKTPIMVGGNGAALILSLAVKYADEWNAIYRTPVQFAELNTKLNQLLDENPRPGSEIKRSQMMGVVYGADQTELNIQLGGRNSGECWQRGMLAGCASQIIDQLGELKASGVEQVILQWSELESLQRLEAFSKQVLPGVLNL